MEVRGGKTHFTRAPRLPKPLRVTYIGNFHRLDGDGLNLCVGNDAEHSELFKCAFSSYEIEWMP